jgi:glucosamine-6-phosphate deaminase
MSEPIQTFQTGLLPVSIYPDNNAMGRAAALVAQEEIVRAIEERGEANVILATGNSQLSFLHALRELEGIEWSKVRVFHMDEYLGLAEGHSASFPRFLKEHILSHINPGAFHPVPGDPEDVEQACREYEALLRQHPADLVAMGWGENGHIAFNDPPEALFQDPVWVKVIELAEASRRQQVGEGHFGSLNEVPTHAITLTIPALLAPRKILCIVPESRKAEAVRACLTGPIEESCPGSILRTVAHAHLFLDTDSASLLP